MSTVPLSGVNLGFLASSRFPAFDFKCPAFFAYFELEKMRSRCALLSVKWNSDDSATNFQCSAMLTVVKLCVFCLFVNLRLSPGHVRAGIKISRVIVAWAKSV